MIALKKTIVITGISATLSIVPGVGALNAALLSNMQASFDSGRYFSAAQLQVQQHELPACRTRWKRRSGPGPNRRRSAPYEFAGRL